MVNIFFFKKRKYIVQWFFYWVVQKNRKTLTNNTNTSQINFIENILGFCKNYKGSEKRGSASRKGETTHKDLLLSATKYWTKNNIKDEICNESQAAIFPTAGSAKGSVGFLCSFLSLFKYFIQLSMFMCSANCHLYFKSTLKWILRLSQAVHCSWVVLNQGGTLKWERTNEDGYLM